MGMLKPSAKSFFGRTESIQYNVALAITGAVRGSAREKLYLEMGLEHLHFFGPYFPAFGLNMYLSVFSANAGKCGPEKLRIQTLFTQCYIHELLPSICKCSQHANTFNTFCCRTEYFKNSFFSSVVNDRNKLDPDSRDCSIYSIFYKSLLKFIRPFEKETYQIKVLTKLRLSFSYFCGHKFRYNFKDTR